MNHHHHIHHTAHCRVLDELHTLTIQQVQALVDTVGETPRDEQLAAMALTTELEEALPAAARRLAETQIAGREDLREAAGNAPHRIDHVDLDEIGDDDFDEILDDVDRFCHVIDCLAFALTEYARHGIHGATARYRLLIQPWAAVMGDPCEP